MYLCVAAAIALSFGLLGATSAAASELRSASFRVQGTTLTGGGYVAAMGSGLSMSVTAVGQASAIGDGSAANRSARSGSLPFLLGDELILADSDLDGFPYNADNCPYAFNPAQLDNGGWNTVVADGNGDACQCGDVTDDGIVDGLDLDDLQIGLTEPDVNLFLVAPAKCNVRGPVDLTDCNAVDLAVSIREVALLTTNGPVQVCDPAVK